MARKSSKKSSTLAELYDRVAASLRQSGGAASIAVMAVSIAVAIVLLAVGIPRLRGYLDARSFVPAESIGLSFVDPPSWWDAPRAEDMRRMVANAAPAMASRPPAIAISSTGAPDSTPAPVAGRRWRTKSRRSACSLS